ncbi:N(2)-citryl-N(6)-acetyl-N(6)-hydroxylysine synthase [Vibrio sp.]|nr:N(2)-citryl-N(6)-acetyl-N(6)-hydroxylysine synthase [Vibrio sp.]
MYRDIPTTCFLNALIREHSTPYFTDKIETSGELIIPLANGDKITVTATFISTLGSHEYLFPAVLRSGTVSSSLDHNMLISMILSEESMTKGYSEEQKSVFEERVLESVRNTQSAIQHNPYQSQLFSKTIDFKTSEQGLLIGHSFHPAPKSREQFTHDDALQYSPEYGAHCQLQWLAVSNSILLSGSAHNQPISHYVTRLVSQDPALSRLQTEKVKEGETLLPMHPWQWKQMTALPSIQTYLKEGAIRDLELSGFEWYPTSSTRALFSPHAPYMLKFSLSLKLTNSIRHLSYKELIRGVRLKELCDNENIHPPLTILHEPAYLGLIDQQGNVIDETLVALRDNPFFHATDHQHDTVSNVLATMTQQSPYSSSSLVSHYVECHAKSAQVSPHDAANQWFEAFCDNVVVPLFSLQANQGIVLLAHQQNIILKLKQGLPVGMFYRDCQGTGYTDLAFKHYLALSMAKKEEVENYWNQDKVQRYFAYYLIINSTFGTISSIASGIGCKEETLLLILRKRLTALLKSGVEDDACLKYVLESDSLCCKGNFFCYLQNENENAIPDPSIIYFDLKNPLWTQGQLVASEQPHGNGPEAVKSDRVTSHVDKQTVKKPSLQLPEAV